MSAEKLIITMEKLLKLHQSLYELSVKKTEIVKNGDIDALNQSLKDEQAHVAAIKKFENERQTLAAAMIPGKEHPSLADCLEVMEGLDKDRLGELRSEMMELLIQIQKRNELNQKLVYQSLQYVNFSLNLIRPRTENMNYGPNAGKTNHPGQAAGLFNSKV